MEIVKNTLEHQSCHKCGSIVNLSPDDIKKTYGTFTEYTFWRCPVCKHVNYL
jgi:uncharacterized protein with PIN domain